MAAVRALIVTSLAIVFIMLAGPPMFAHPPTLYTGVHLHRTGEWIQRLGVTVDPHSPAYRAGLRTGDTVSCLAQRDLSMLFMNDLDRVAPGYVPQASISLCAERAGRTYAIRFVPEMRPPPPSIYANDGLAVLRLAEYAVFLLCGIALVLGRPSLMTWIFYAFCLASLPNLAILVNMTSLPPALYAADIFITVTMGQVSVGFLLLFALLVPDDRLRGGWRVPAFWIASAATAASGLLAVFARVQSVWYVMPKLNGGIDEFLTTITVAVVLARLVAMERTERARFGWAAFAIIWGVVTNLLRSSQVLPGNGGTVFALLSVVMPIALMYAILRRHVIDVRFVISRTVVYAAITTFVVIFIGVVDWATSRYLTQARVAMALEALVTIGLGLVLHRTYRWVEYAVDFLLFRRKHEAETYLSRLAKTLPFAEREEAVDRALVHDPYEKLELVAAALFRSTGSGYAAVRCEGWKPDRLPAFERDHDLVRFMLSERGRVIIADLRTYVAEPFREHGAVPAVAMPVFQGNRLTAFAVYGIHRSGTKLDPDEVESLQHLCDAAAQAYTGLELARYEHLPQAPLVVEAL